MSRHALHTNSEPSTQLPASFARPSSAGPSSAGPSFARTQPMPLQSAQRNPYIVTTGGEQGEPQASHGGGAGNHQQQHALEIIKHTCTFKGLEVWENVEQLYSAAKELTGNLRQWSTGDVPTDFKRELLGADDVQQQALFGATNEVCNFLEEQWNHDLGQVPAFQHDFKDIVVWMSKQNNETESTMFIGMCHRAEITQFVSFTLKRTKNEEDTLVHMYVGYQPIKMRGTWLTDVLSDDDVATQQHVHYINAGFVASSTDPGVMMIRDWVQDTDQQAPTDSPPPTMAAFYLDPDIDEHNAFITYLDLDNVTELDDFNTPASGHDINITGSRFISALPEILESIGHASFPGNVTIRNYDDTDYQMYYVPKLEWIQTRVVKDRNPTYCVCLSLAPHGFDGTHYDTHEIYLYWSNAAGQQAGDYIVGYNGVHKIALGIHTDHPHNAEALRVLHSFLAASSGPPGSGPDPSASGDGSHAAWECNAVDELFWHTTASMILGIDDTATRDDCLKAFIRAIALRLFDVNVSATAHITLHGRHDGHHAIVGEQFHVIARTEGGRMRIFYIGPDHPKHCTRCSDHDAYGDGGAAHAV